MRRFIMNLRIRLHCANESPPYYLALFILPIHSSDSMEIIKMQKVGKASCRRYCSYWGGT
jgi:hypothetical protein